MRTPTGPGVAYFCAVLPDDAAEPRPRQCAPSAAISGAGRGGDLARSGARRSVRLERAVRSATTASGATGSTRSTSARTSRGTDRYVTTPAGSVDARLDPGQSGFENLVLAGDWTHNGIDGGCVEAAVVSGERAAEALIAAAAGAERGRRDAPIRRVRRTRHGARTAAVRASAAVLLLVCDRPGARPATVRPRAQGSRPAARCATSYRVWRR